jgi:hypothetical protein
LAVAEAAEAATYQVTLAEVAEADKLLDVLLTYHL